MPKNSRMLATLLVSIMMACVAIASVTSVARADDPNYIQLDVSLSANDYKSFSGNLTKGERVAFNIGSDQQFDFFIFDSSQFELYQTNGRFISGYPGPAIFSSLGTFGIQDVFTAPTDGQYYIVLDNTVAGVNQGDVGKTIDVGVAYPYNPNTSSGYPWLSILLVGGLLVVVIVVVWALTKGRRRDE